MTNDEGFIWDTMSGRVPKSNGLKLSNKGGHGQGRIRREIERVMFACMWTVLLRHFSQSAADQGLRVGEFTSWL